MDANQKRKMGSVRVMDIEKRRVPSKHYVSLALFIISKFDVFYDVNVGSPGKGKSNYKQPCHFEPPPLLD